MMTMQENMHNGHLQGMYAFKTFFNKPLQTTSINPHFKSPFTIKTIFTSFTTQLTQVYHT